MSHLNHEYYPDPTAGIAIGNSVRSEKKMQKKAKKNKIPYEHTTAGGAKMKLIYISHPYSGEEKKNRNHAEEIAAKLASLYPHIVFVNPLNAMRHITKTKLTYGDTIALCIGLLAACDGIIMTGDWQKSNGCKAERDFAVSRGMTVWDGEDNFADEDAMPNDCCGKHSDCKNCLCRECVHRLACWNCNDCAEVSGQKPVGFTGDGVWECSRHSRKGA